MLPTLLPDKPVTGSSSYWQELDQFASDLALLIPTLPTTSPLLVMGDWGSGKTSLLMAVACKLDPSIGPDLGVEEDGKGKASAIDGTHPVVWFNAWQYESEEFLLPALMHAVWKRAPTEITSDNKNKPIFRKVWKAAASMCARRIPQVLGLMYGPLVKNLANEFLSEYSDADPGKSLEPPEVPSIQLWKHFQKMLETAWGSGETAREGDGPIIIIDDLDRCSPSSAVDLLDQIRILVTSTHAGINARFVVAMDRSVMIKAVANKFVGMDEYDANRYLEKFFPVAVQVPALTDAAARTLTSRLLGASARKISAASPDASSGELSLVSPLGFLDEGQDERAVHQDALMAALSEPLFANPRLIKRCINRYALLIAIERRKSREDDKPSSSLPHTEDRGHEGHDKALQQNQVLAQWIAATERWPILRRVMQRHGRDYWQQIQTASEDGRPMPGPEADAMRREQGLFAWYKKHMSDRYEQYRAADERLGRVGL